MSEAWIKKIKQRPRQAQLDKVRDPFCKSVEDTNYDEFLIEQAFERIPKCTKHELVRDSDSGHSFLKCTKCGVMFSASLEDYMLDYKWKIKEEDLDE